MGHEITNKCVLVCDNPMGGTLDLVADDGEVLAHLHIPQGRHRASQWVSLVEPGQSLQIAEGVVCFQPRMGVSQSRHPLGLKSDANPDFVPTSASRLEREMRIELGEMRNARMALQKEARQRGLDAVQLVEPIPDNGKPKPKPKPKAQADQDEAES